MMITEKLDWRLLKLRPETGKIVFTYADIEKLPEYPEGPLVEIIGGEQYIVPSPDLNHQRISRKLESILLNFVEKSQLGEVFDAPVDVILSEEDVVVPDIIFVSSKNKGLLREKNIQGAPDLIVEILSENRNRDLIYKKELYEKFGIKEYWIIDPGARSIFVYTLDPVKKRFSKVKTFQEGSILPVSVIAGLEIPVCSVFEGIP